LAEYCLTGVVAMVDVRWMMFGVRDKEWSRVWVTPCSQDFLTCCVLLIVQMVQMVSVQTLPPKLTQFQVMQFQIDGISEKSKSDIIWFLNST